MCISIQDITDIVQAFAVAAVAIPAFLGLNTLRKQLIGKRKIELAEEVLTLSYTLQYAIKSARYPGSYSSEGTEREGRDQEPEAQRNRNDSYYAPISRLSQHSEEFSRLLSSSMRFRAYYGEQGQESLAAFNIVRNKIYGAVGMLINKSQEERVSSKLIEKWHNTIWDMSTEDEPDEINLQINDAVAEIERICRPILTKV